MAVQEWTSGKKPTRKGPAGQPSARRGDYGGSVAGPRAKGAKPGPGAAVREPHMPGFV